MILLWKAVVLEVGMQGLQAQPQKFWLAKNLGKALKIRVKISLKIVCLQKMAPKVCINTHEDLFWTLHQKEVFMIFVGKNLEAKIAQKKQTYRASLGKFRAKSFVPQIFACSYTYDEKAPLPSLPLFWKGRKGNRPVTRLGHHGWRRVFWEGPTFFKLCPIVLTYNTLFQGGR